MRRPTHPKPWFFARCLLACGLACNILSVSQAAGDLAKVVQPLIDAHHGRVSVAIKHLATGESFTYQSDLPMPTASLIKLPLMVAAYQAIEEGKLSLTQKISLRKEDKVPGSGILTPHFSGGATLSLQDAIHLMMVYSDNTATNLVIDQVGLPATAKLMETLGCPNTKLHSKVFRRDTSIFPQRSKEFGLGSTTASEIVRLLAGLHRGELVSKTASEQMLAHMLASEYRNRIPRLLPAGTKVANKGGSVSASRCDAGVVDSPSGSFALCILTTENEDRRYADDNEATLLCANIAKAAYDHFNPDGAKEKTGAPQVLMVGAGGKLVEALQRTLNTRLPSSPQIAVDGDFGPMTEAAVKRFQQAKGLEESGEVGSKTWDALGTLVETDPDAPDPAEVNAQKIEKQPADPLTGPPHVTCKAWAIGDGETGELLWGNNHTAPLDIASTTKMMVAYVVVSLAEKDPSVLDEIVTFSLRADETGGSTSGVRAGEKLPVGELLYGLLLPSGNDASVAFAEHFGPRLVEAAKRPNEAEAYDRFLTAMNRTAKQLGMSESNFTNTAGFTEPNHHSSAADLLTLAAHAMQKPLFRNVVGTLQHGTTVTGPGGYRRNVFWRNTNRLLRTEGYNGVKTGTTSAAGSCLVSSSQRDGRSLIAVVLGATSTDARYVDTRNLMRWAHHQQALPKSPSAE